MTDWTPARARELAQIFEDEKVTGVSSLGLVLLSLADQVEALTAENANILRASNYSADLATQAMEEVKKLTAERDALRKAMVVPDFSDGQQDWGKVDGAIAFHLIERHSENWGHAGQLMDAFAQSRIDKAIAAMKEPK